MRIRSGTAADVPELARLMYLQPSREAVGLAGSAENGRRFQEELLHRGLRQRDTCVLVAEDGAELLGFAIVSDGSDVPPLRAIVPMGVRAMGVLGAARAGWRSSARLAVDIRPPPRGLHLTELQVRPDRRGQGTGDRLLREVEAEARRRGCAHISLTTGSCNPARRLYERHGYEVTATRSSARYTRLTGIPGRVLMVKSLRG